MNLQVLGVVVLVNRAKGGSKKKRILGLGWGRLQTGNTSCLLI